MQETYEETLAEIIATYRQAAECFLAKTAWLKQKAGKYYDKIARSAAWKEISKQYDAITKDTIDNQPLRLLIAAMHQAETKLQEGQALNAIDIAIIDKIHAISKNREYLRLHRERLKLEKYHKNEELKLKQNEDKRKDAAEARSAELHTKILEQTGKSGIFTALELEPMCEEDYREYLGGSYEP